MLTFITAILITATPADLGERLFNETAFSSPKGDFRNSCASCHHPETPAGYQAFADDLAYSWRPWRSGDTGRDTLRNAPALIDVARMPRLHHDGEFASLEEQSFETFAGRNFGWLPEERGEALHHAANILRGGEYAAEIEAVFDIDVAEANDEQLVEHASRALAEFMRTLNSPRDSLYDRFIAMNTLSPAPAEGESAAAYGVRLVRNIAEKRRNNTLSMPDGFDFDELMGLYVFFRTEGELRVGNCVACHAPPDFTDFQFHNAGVTQEEYDNTHGDGAFAKLDIPDDSARPVDRFLQSCDSDQPEHVDLGYWNFVEKGAPDEYVAAFKTPTLRDLGVTGPYMHNGAYESIESALRQKIRAGRLAQAGKLRNPDPEIAKISMSGQDIKVLFAFLNTLNQQAARPAEPEKIVDGQRDPTDNYPRY